MELTKNKLAKYFDHTFLKAYATDNDLRKLCEEAKSIGAAMVAINTEWVTFCKKELDGTDIHVGAAIGFPLGQCGLETKLFETEDAIKKGADEIDYVINISKAKMGDWDFIKKEMEEGSSVEALAEELIRKNPEVILVSDEVGYGVVPVDAFQRAYREAVGRTCTKLASFSRKVTRVVCGIGTVIKHD